jgi:hypothetical protein
MLGHHDQQRIGREWAGDFNYIPLCSTGILLEKLRYFLNFGHPRGPKNFFYEYPPSEPLQAIGESEAFGPLGRATLELGCECQLRKLLKSKRANRVGFCGT